MDDIKKVMKDYEPKEDIWSEDDCRTYLTKKAVWELPEPDRLIIVLYSELGSLRKLGEKLGVSRTTCYLYIKRIKASIAKYVEEEMEKCRQQQQE